MTFRFARHTNDLERLTKFYTKVLGLEIIGIFEDHDNYNGVFLGKKGKDWHLEFTDSDETAEHTFDDDDMLVFYPDNQEEYDQIMARLKLLGIEEIRAKNRYWNDNGVMFLDPDGFRVVVSPLKITEA